MLVIVLYSQCSIHFIPINVVFLVLYSILHLTFCNQYIGVNVYLKKLSNYSNKSGET